MRLAVIGAGGIGGYFGARLAQAGEDVSFIARGEHLRAIKARGLRVRSPSGDFTVNVPATDDPRTMGPMDVVLFCVKSYDTESAAEAIRPVVGPDTDVLSLQNGVDNEEKLGRILGPGHVLGGAAYIFSFIGEPGLIEHTSGGRIVFGEMNQSRSERCHRLLTVLERAKISAQVSEDIHRTLWEKYCFICAGAGLTSLTRLPMGAIRACPETWQLYGQIVEEAITVGRASGVALPPDLLDRTLAMAQRVDPGAYSSMHYDLTHGKRLELEALHGHVVGLGRRFGFPTPACFAIYAALRPYMNGPPAA